MWTSSSELPSHEKPVSCIRWSKDGSHLVTSSSDRKLRLFSVSNSEIRLKHDFEAAGSEKLSWNPTDFFSFASVSLKNPTVRFYDFRSRDEAWSISTGADNNFSLCWSTHGDYAIVTTKKDSIIVIDCRNRSIFRSGSTDGLEIHSSLCIPSSFLRVGLNSSGQTHSELSDEDLLVLGIGLPATNNEKTSRATDEGGFQINKTSEPGCNLYQNSCHCGFVTSLAFSNNIMAVGSADATISLWNGDLTSIGVISRHETAVRDVSISACGSHIASSAQDNQMIVSSITTGCGSRPVSEVVEFGSALVKSVDFYPIADSSRSNTAIVGLEDRTSSDRRSLIRLVSKNSEL